MANKLPRWLVRRSCSSAPAAQSHEASSEHGHTFGLLFFTTFSTPVEAFAFLADGIVATPAAQAGLQAGAQLLRYLRESSQTGTKKDIQSRVCQRTEPLRVFAIRSSGVRMLPKVLASRPRGRHPRRSSAMQSQHAGLQHPRIGYVLLSFDVNKH